MQQTEPYSALTLHIWQEQLTEYNESIVFVGDGLWVYQEKLKEF